MIYLTLIGSVIAGAFAVMKLDLGKPRRLKLVTAFTGAYLMALTCLHLIPEVFGNGHAHHHHGHHHGPPAITLGAFILIGFFLQVLLDHYSGGIEHGHAHPTPGAMPLAMIAGLCVHAFLEAMPLAHMDTPRLLTAIAVHKFPVSIVLLSMLLQSCRTTQNAYLTLAIFAVMAPLGTLIGSQPALEHQAPFLLALVIGIFMHVSTTILFESSEDHHYNRRKALAIILGAAVAALGVFLPIHAH